MISIRRGIATLLIVSMSAIAIPLPAQATLIETAETAASVERARVASFLQRAEVRKQLEALGVRPADVQARVDALSDRETAELAAQIDAAPAGGIDVLAAALIVFLVLLLTDILGYTKIFPFTKSMR